MISYKLNVLFEEVRSLGKRDAKGREVGVRARVYPKYVTDRDGATVDPLQVAGYQFCPHSTRDGKPFGALPVRSYKTFPTLEEATAYARASLDRNAPQGKTLAEVFSDPVQTFEHAATLRGNGD